ncbi:MAG: D-2-hydroxyacid dehydrogenase [Planctomycetota bacterium]|nr:D-2-hydroxyacid dehydrogenase [Planctomycetota bacterium]
MKRIVMAAVVLCGMALAAAEEKPKSPEAKETLVYWTSALDADRLAEMKRLAPNVRFVTDLKRGPAAVARAAEFHGADAHLLTPEFLTAAKNLRWVQSWSAGVDRYLGLKDLMQNDRITFTNMKGAHGPVISEHVFAMLLYLRRDLQAYTAAQRENRWDRRAGQGQKALAGTTLVVAGMGGIGREIAKRGKAFDMKVLATVRTARKAPDYVDELGTAKDLDRFLAQADVVAISLPLTDQTRGLFDAERIAKIKPGAVLINIARGPIVDSEALVQALESGHLAGAGLDVTDPEPLPETSPLWAMKNVIITPHVAGRAELTRTRRLDIFRKNVERFAQGKPLVNVVDKKAGY